jgi:hypothetical protein
MKLKDITHSSERWSTPLGTMDAHALVADGVLVALSLWGTSIIGLAVQCPDGKYFGSIRSMLADYQQRRRFPVESISTQEDNRTARGYHLGQVRVRYLAIGLVRPWFRFRKSRT